MKISRRKNLYSIFDVCDNRILSIHLFPQSSAVVYNFAFLHRGGELSPFRQRLKENTKVRSGETNECF